MREEGRVCLAGARWGGWGEVRALGSSQRPLRKGLQCAAVWLPPLRGPDRYKLRAIKLSPCHLRRIQSRAGKGREGRRGGRGGEEGVRDGVVGREGSCSASHTNFLTPLFTSLFFFFSPPFPTLTTNHITHQLYHLTSQHPLFSFSSSSLPILLASASVKANRLTSCLYFIINAV